MQSIRMVIKGLAREELREWAGTKIYNRGRDYVDAVSQLSRTEDGNLVAWVSGSDEYVTSVKYSGNGEFSHTCTCPYDDGPCKHAVAVVLAAAAHIKNGEAIPLLDPGDDLSLELFDNREDEDEVIGGNDDDEDDDNDLSNDLCRCLPKNRSPQVEKLLAGKSREELLELLRELAMLYPEVARKLRESTLLKRGQVEPLVCALRKDIRRLTGEDAWYNPWRRQGHLPDYSHVREQLQTLLTGGHADAVLGLGEELWQRGNEQVGQSNDEGETASAISACLDIVLRAVPRTSKTPAEQLLWVINRSLEDEYSLLEGTESILNNKIYAKSHWHEVAKGLAARLQTVGKPQSNRFSESYRRGKLMSWLLDAYRRAGQPEKVIPLLEKEADACQSYGLLVDALLEIGERERARRWCIDGYARTIGNAPGIAAGLQERLRKLAEKEKNFSLAAAYWAEDFFERPSEQGFVELRKAAEKIKSWTVVREGVLAYLRSGQRPGGRATPWPLPEPEVRRPKGQDKHRQERFPNLEMLIDIATLEKRNDDIVTLYQELNATKRWGREPDKKVAMAVAESHPEVALRIWKVVIDGLIAEVKPRAYEEAAGYLKLMCAVYTKTGRLTDWQGLLAGLRVQHKAKRRLLGVLDDLEKNLKRKRKQGELVE